MIMAVVLTLAFGTFGYAQETAEVANADVMEFGGVVLDGTSQSATVEAVDAAARTVTLKNAAGELKTIPCGPEVRNFDQIKVGDTVTVKVTQLAEVLVTPDAKAGVARKEELEMTGAPLGEKPKGTMTATIKVQAVVDSVDYATRKVVLQGPEQKVALTVGPDAVNFGRVKKGDSVSLKLTERTEISVTGA